MTVHGCFSFGYYVLLSIGRVLSIGHRGLLGDLLQKFKCIHYYTLIFSLGVSALLSLMASVVPAAFTEVLATGSGGANDAEVHIEKAMGDVLEDVGVDASTCYP